MLGWQLHCNPEYATIPRVAMQPSPQHFNIDASNKRKTADMDLLSAILTLFLVMDPIGNVPFFVGAFKDVEESRRIWVVARECVIALLILLFFLFFGPTLMLLLGIGQASLHISGGVVLFIISVGIIFPNSNHIGGLTDKELENEPFIVPLAIPFIAGPSTMATIMILSSRQPDQPWLLVVALAAAWILTAGILMLSAPLSRILGGMA